ncbi:hypothetical protein VYU27_006455 [Nannochloropsis oceanica]
MATPKDHEDRSCLLPLTILHQSRALATCLHANDLSHLSLSNRACRSFWPQVQSLHVPFFQYSLLSRHAVNKARTDGFRRACQEGQLKHLVNLSLNGANLEDKDFERLASDILPYLPQLETLDVGNNPSLLSLGLNYLACSPNALPSNLRDLRLAHNPNMCRGAYGGAHLGRLLIQLWPRLECLDLTQTGVTEDTLRIAVDLLKCLTELREGGGGRERKERGNEDEAKGPRLPQLGVAGLRELRLGQNILQGRGSAQVLSAALECPGRPGTKQPLERLILDDCYMGDEGLAFFAEASLCSGQFCSLRELHLQNNRCGEGGARALGKACVEGLPALEFLGLQMNMMGNVGALALVEGMVGEEEDDGGEGGEGRDMARWEKMKEAVVKKEGDKRSLPRLKRLDLSHNMIDALGVERFSKLLLGSGRCPSLEELDLTHNAVREKEAWELQRAIHFCSSRSSTTISALTKAGSTTTITTVTTFFLQGENKETEVKVRLSPGLYCQVLLEGEEEEEEVGRRGRGDTGKSDALVYRLMLSVSDLVDFAFDLCVGEDEE